MTLSQEEMFERNLELTKQRLLKEIEDLRLSNGFLRMPESSTCPGTRQSF